MDAISPADQQKLAKLASNCLPMAKTLDKKLKNGEVINEGELRNFAESLKQLRDFMAPIAQQQSNGMK